MRVRFWGVRGSIPMPLAADEVVDKIARCKQGESLAPEQVTVGGNTPCVSVTSGDTLIILDAGSGMKSLGLELMRGDFGRGHGTAHLFLSHTHWDHIQGFPFFVPAYVPGNVICVYGAHPRLQQRLADQQRPEFFPVPLDAMAASLRFQQLADGHTVNLGDVRVTHLRLPHPGGSFAYRLESQGVVVVYATDGEYPHQLDGGGASVPHLYSIAVDPYVDFFREADLLVFDAMYELQESIEKATWGHSTAVVGVDLAVRAGVKQLVLFHHDHTAPDERVWRVGDTARAYLALDPRQPALEVQVAYEGLELSLGGRE